MTDAARDMRRPSQDIEEVVARSFKGGRPRFEIECRAGVKWIRATRKTIGNNLSDVGPFLKSLLWKIYLNNRLNSSGELFGAMLV